MTQRNSAGLIGLLLVAWTLTGCGSETPPDNADNADNADKPASEFSYANVPVLPVIDPAEPGSLTVFADWPSERVAARDISVWLPPGYRTDVTYPVVIVVDGLMGSERIMAELVERQAIRPAILVGVPPSRYRVLEMAPQDVMTDYFPPDTLQEARRQLERGPGIPADQPLTGNAYLSFLTDELLPWIEDAYPAARGPDNTFIMGASMGGLMALYAIVKRPDVFGGAAALSTHWPVMGDYMTAWLAPELPFPGTNRLYFDRGTEGADAGYAPYQRDVDVLLRSLGVPFVSHVFQGHTHTVDAWQRRMHLPLQFLLGS